MPPSDPPPQLSEEEIFQVAAALPPSERVPYLLASCEGHPAVRAAVEQLLASIEDQAFMKRAADRGVSPEVEAELARLKPEEMGERIGNYKLLEQIGEGGFGVVWVAEQEKPVRRRVALKIIKLGMDTREVIARFEQERQALAMMDHPNIAKVLDAGATPLGRPYFVMELVRGVKITEYCDQANLPTAERLRLFIAVCHAVQHAHQKGIIHRDLKPSNILVTLHDGVPVPKVIDFGVAKATQQQRLTDLTVYTQFEQMIGTPLYMSPEQAEMSGLDIDTRSDIYSLGVLLYELLVGRTPFDPEALMKKGLDEIRRAVREQEPQKPSTFVSTMAVDLRTNLAQHRQTDSAKLVGQIRGDLDWIVMKALEKDRARRYETANGLAQDIQRHLVSEPVQARPPTQLYRFRRFAKRNKLAFAAATAVLAALITGLSLSTWMFFQEKQARERAVAAEQEQARLRGLAVSAEKVQSEERKKAESEASKSRQVAQFLTDMLKGVRPAVARGNDTTVLRAILDATAERVGKDLKTQPDVEADLRFTLGEVYAELGAFEKADAMQSEALRIRRNRLGDHSDVARSLEQGAKVANVLGRKAEAESMGREALAIQRKLLGTEHPDVAALLNTVSELLYSQGKLGEAETMAREALSIHQRLFGNGHGATANSMTMLALVLERQGKLDEAETFHREALAIRNQLFGHEYPSVGDSLYGLAMTLHRQGKLDESEGMYREALSIRKKLGLSEHPFSAMLLNNLGLVLCDQRKLAEGEIMLRNALTMQRKLAGNEHPQVANFLTNLGCVLRDQGQFAQGETMLREAVAMRRKLSGDEHPDVAQPLAQLAATLERRGKLAEAEILLREALTILPRSATSESSVSILNYCLAALAENLFRQSKYADAEPLYRELIDSRARFPGEHEDVLTPTASLGRLLADWAWAERDSKSPLRISSRADQNGLPVAAGPGSTAADSNSKIAERVQEAERLLRDCLAIRLRGTDASHWRTADVRSRLGGALLSVAVTEPALSSEARLEKLAEAEVLLLAGNEALQQSEKADRRYKRDALTRLVRLYETRGTADKVADWQQQLADFDKAEGKTEAATRAVSPEP